MTNPEEVTTAPSAAAMEITQEAPSGAAPSMEAPSATRGGGSSPGCEQNEAVRLEDFLGEWRDSMGHQVRVSWAQQGNRFGELDVQLLRPGSTSRVRLNVKALLEGQFQCGHFELKLDKSSPLKMVWADKRSMGKVSVWDRAERRARSRSRSRGRGPSPSQRVQKCAFCVMKGLVSLRCKDHQPLAPPRSVMQAISTPGAWAPPAAVPEIIEKHSEVPDAWIGNAPEPTGPETWIGNAPEVAEIVQKPSEVPQIIQKPSGMDQLLEAYDESLTKGAAAAEPPKPQGSPDALHEAKAKLLVKHFEMGEAEAKLLVPEMLAKPVQHCVFAHKGLRASPTKDPRSKDPRLRGSPTKAVAPTGGA